MLSANVRTIGVIISGAALLMMTYLKLTTGIDISDGMWLAWIMAFMACLFA